ncbi:MAG: hypothetical protein RLZZ415_1896 [Pseudomonadota bacterium]
MVFDAPGTGWDDGCLITVMAGVICSISPPVAGVPWPLSLPPLSTTARTGSELSSGSLGATVGSSATGDGGKVSTGSSSTARTMGAAGAGS